ncbi:hypothetical protein AB833_05685 [Chromatiales bacterium (ex Bugula neritina AB1)]|nr:hypothetical protein AB833_05685 [Chromatiales bacterium (ex Bugula neritina AB1)]
MSTYITESILSQAQLDALQKGSANGAEISTHDFDVLQQSGFLVQAVPEDLGGLGLSYTEVRQQLHSLAEHSPTLARAIGAHIGWTGVAGELWKSDNVSLEWLLREACDGAFFVSECADTTNTDRSYIPACKIDIADGGYCFSGQTRVTPLAWSWLAISGVWSDGIVYAFVTRDAPGLLLGNGSDITLDAVFVANKHITLLHHELSPDQPAVDDMITSGYLRRIIHGIDGISPDL